jgi:hypothetical protein
MCVARGERQEFDVSPTTTPEFASFFSSCCTVETETTTCVPFPAPNILPVGLHLHNVPAHMASSPLQHLSADSADAAAQSTGGMMAADSEDSEVSRAPLLLSQSFAGSTACTLLSVCSATATACLLVKRVGWLVGCVPSPPESSQHADPAPTTAVGDTQDVAGVWLAVVMARCAAHQEETESSTDDDDGPKETPEEREARLRVRSCAVMYLTCHACRGGVGWVTLFSRQSVRAYVRACVCTNKRVFVRGADVKRWFGCPS